jgi:hypothetical protein
VGASGAGKTALLTALLDMARKTGRGDVYRPRPGENLYFEEIFRHFEGNLASLQRGERLDHTDRVWPMLLELPRGIRPQRRFVYFYDLMGEICRAREEMSDYPYLADSRAMIFLADVLYEILPEGSWEKGRPYAGTPVGGPMGEVYHELVEYLRGELGAPPFPIPLAVVVPKIDLLRKLPEGDFPEGRLFRHSTAGLQSEAVQGWLRRDVRRPNARTLVDRIDQEFTDSKFWAFSATDAVTGSDRNTEVLTEVFDWVLGRRRRRRWTVRYR